MNRVTWSQLLVLKMKKTMCREMKLPPKIWTKFSAAKVESVAPGSQHTSHSFSSNNMNSHLMLPWHLTESSYAGGIWEPATKLESLVSASSYLLWNHPPWEYWLMFKHPLYFLMWILGPGYSLLSLFKSDLRQLQKQEEPLAFSSESKTLDRTLDK